MKQLKLPGLFNNKSVNKQLVFVYGTLKKSEPNHNYLQVKDNRHVKFLSKAKTVKKYPLVIASKYNIPFLLYKPGTGENVLGEIYEVDDGVLSELDVLEDHPSFYVREKESVEVIQSIENTDLTQSQREMDCWIYFLKQFKPSLLSEPYLVEYHSKGAHAKPYTPRSERIPGYHAKTDVLLEEPRNQ